MISADSIRHRFGDREILRGVALSLRQGEVVGLLGANGAGKSSILRILFGQLRADHAYISVDGVQHRVLYQRPGLVNLRPQGQTFPSHLTVGRLLQLHHLKESDFFAAYPKFAGKARRKLSLLHQRLFETLVLLETTTRFTLLDEPFAGLSPSSVERVQETIRRQQSAKGFLLADHNYEAVLTSSDRSFLLIDGHLRSVTDRDELFNLGYLPPPPPPPFKVDPQWL